MLHVLDTSSLIVLQHYFPKQFPSFWRNFDTAIAEGEVVSVREVLKEFSSDKPWLMAWAKQQSAMFLTPGSAETAFVAKIFRVPHFQNLVTERQRLRGQPVADPFIIACASVRNGCVVTEESPRPNSAKIPNVCAHFGVECTNMEGFLAARGWMF